MEGLCSKHIQSGCVGTLPALAFTWHLLDNKEYFLFVCVAVVYEVSALLKYCILLHTISTLLILGTIFASLGHSVSATK